jgi:hypothetical protein
LISIRFQLISTMFAKLGIDLVFSFTFRTQFHLFCTTVNTKTRIRGIIMLTIWAGHFFVFFVYLDINIEFLLNLTYISIDLEMAFSPDGQNVGTNQRSYGICQGRKCKILKDINPELKQKQFHQTGKAF